jgi:hypothetical protein
LLILTNKESKKLKQECENILKVKQIIQDFCSDKSNQHEDYPGDLNNPLFLLPERLKSAAESLDILYVTKQKQLD